MQAFFFPLTDPEAERDLDSLAVGRELGFAIETEPSGATAPDRQRTLVVPDRLGGGGFGGMSEGQIPHDRGPGPGKPELLRIGPADPTIREVMRAYRDSRHPDRATRLPRALRLLQAYMNEWSHIGLTLEQEAVLARFWDAPGPGRREYCDFFGPDLVPEELEFFFGCYINREVPVRARALAGLSAELARFVEWLAEHDYVGAEAARRAAALALAAPDALARAERAKRILSRHAAATPARDREKIRTVEGEFTVKARRLGRVWLESWDDGAICGPVAVPPAAYDLLGEQWEVAGAVGYWDRRWRLLDVRKVHPDYSM